MMANVTNSSNSPDCSESHGQDESVLEQYALKHSSCPSNLLRFATVPESETGQISEDMQTKDGQNVQHDIIHDDSLFTPAQLTASAGYPGYLGYAVNTIGKMAENSFHSPPTSMSYDCSMCKEVICPAMLYCDGCGEYLCQQHSEDHHSRYHHHLAFSVTAMCTKHRMKLEYYCRDCKTCICVHCKQEIRKHDCITLEEAFTEMTRLTELKLSGLGLACTDMSACVCRSSELENDLAKKEMDIEQKIRQYMQLVHEAVDKHGEELISSLPSKRLQVEAHKQSIQSLLTRVTDKTQSCKHMLESNDMVQALLSRSSLFHLLSAANDEVKSTYWQDERFDNNLALESDTTAVLQSVNHSIRVNADNDKGKELVNAYRHAIKADHDVRETLDTAQEEMLEDLKKMVWSEMESRLNQISSSHRSRLHALSQDVKIPGERFDELIQSFELEHDAHVTKKRTNLRQQWEGMVSTEFDAVLLNITTVIVGKLYFAHFAPEESWEETRQETLKNLNRIRERYESGDNYVKNLQEIKLQKGIELLNAYHNSYKRIGLLVEDMRADLKLSTADIEVDLARLAWKDIEKRIYDNGHELESRLKFSAAEIELGEQWSAIMTILVHEWVCRLLAEKRDEFWDKKNEDWRARMQPCMNELDCRKTIIAILKQMRGEDKWNGPDDDGQKFNWREDLNLSEWDGVAFAGKAKRIEVDEAGMIIDLKLNRLRMQGEMPEILGNLTTLTRLCLDDNQLSILPESIGNLELLNGLEVDNNDLSTLPASLKKLNNMTGLYVSGNPITSSQDGQFFVTCNYGKEGMYTHVGADGDGDDWGY